MARDLDEVWQSSEQETDEHAEGEGSLRRLDFLLERPGVDQERFAKPPAPFGWTDGLTDIDGPRFWERIIAVEEARNARHKRISTVALFEVDGYAEAVERWGPTLGLQLFVQLARILVAGIRKSDYIARIGPTRFGVLLTETDEILAINFIDRIQADCRATVDPAANGLRVVSGWASPQAGGSLSDAMQAAEQRLDEVVRRCSFGA